MDGDPNTTATADSKPAAAADAATAVVGDNNHSYADGGVRETLNGCWILDKTRENWSMRGYLEAMDVNELAIKAHEKGEQEYDTFHTIELDRHRVTITKRSRVNADLVIDLPLGGQEHIVYMPPGNRPKRSMATSDHLGHVQIESSLPTVNGLAYVVDTKRLERDVDGDPTKVRVLQTLTITNESTGKTHTTTRYFVPYLDVPPHLADE